MSKAEYKPSKTHVAVTPGESLRIIRELQGLSQSALAEKTGLSQPNISALENGTSQLGRDRSITLAKALGVHPAVLLFPDFDIHQAA
ncbi:MAG: transcriptional regulator [Gammaproteobacteria bacterium CG11_big_fil_rev_8_21_14_0_20_46_22]|nr:MAG: transcriptional regulator [Gammaproteobacteria bacterium CG12_big_fil_rev_8_21_14_0_65_46_12]PIR10141.1 MAG: transcriptional regulator [Gammaproteobacteria bacterium CG11_big_fil_rev_8_21_14_0_20_46_22]